MKERLNEINQDINHILGLISRYPYLSDNFNQVIERLKNQKDELEKINSLEDLPDYEGISDNRIDKDKDDLSVIRAKLQSQQEWIDKNKK